MHTLASIVNEDEQLQEIQLHASEPEMLVTGVAPVLSTPAVLVAAAAAANAAKAVGGLG
ncbi:hypothetical protein ACFU76_36915 [Streptomyces sp. NPDC057539]|uniref:hypothetical protein n=1 Tax=Streptomyces sp. NPDC057539 TaxID=3346159 RepID=UPI0036C439B4